MRTITINQTLTSGRYLLALNCDATPALRAIRGTNAYYGFLEALGASPLPNSLRVNSTYGTFASSGVVWNSQGSGANPLDYLVFVRVSTP